jgi:hypothetical protein
MVVEEVPDLQVRTQQAPPAVVVLAVMPGVVVLIVQLLIPI